MKLTIELEVTGATNPDAYWRAAGHHLMKLGKSFANPEARTEEPAADPQPAAAKATRTKAEPKPVETPPTDPAPSTPPVSTPAIATPETTPSASSSDTPVTEADLTAAANSAVAKLGHGSAAKVQGYIRTTFVKPDGSVGTLKGNTPENNVKMLADLQKIARGELTL